MIPETFAGRLVIKSSSRFTRAPFRTFPRVVMRRVVRMLEIGVFRGFTSVIDRNALVWNTVAYVQVFRHGTIAPDDLRAAWIDIPEVVSAATITGTADAILHVLARDMRHLEEALERIRSAADVERSESIVVLTNIIDRMRG